jgi:F-box/leucine-rich repeat protein 10/11
MFVPSGWIHCVVTTEDSLVFGGNFLHPYCAAMQINIRTLEEQMRIPKKNLITGFDKLNWYGLERLLSELEEALEEDSSLDKIKRRTKKKDKFPIVKFEAIDVISRYLFDKTGNLEDIPDSIDEPKTLIKTIRKLSKLPSLK